MSDDKPPAPPKPIVIGSAVISSETTPTAPPASLGPEGRPSSVWGGMNPELFDAFEQLETILHSRPKNLSLAILALFLTMGIPLLIAFSSDGDVFFSDVAGLCCMSFLVGGILGFGITGHFTSWSIQRDRALKNVLHQAGLESAQRPKWLSLSAFIAIVAGGILGGDEGLGVGFLIAVVLFVVQAVVNAAARSKDIGAIQTLRTAIEAIDGGYGDEV